MGKGTVADDEGCWVDDGYGSAGGIYPFRREGAVVMEEAVEDRQRTALFGIYGATHSDGGAAVELAVCYGE